MVTPSVLRGHYYPTNLEARCPKYHRCLITLKCQNYDQHCAECVFCESRVRPQTNLGGLAHDTDEGRDPQATVRHIENVTGKSFGDPNADIATGIVTAGTDEVDELSRRIKDLSGVDPTVTKIDE